MFSLGKENGICGLRSINIRIRAVTGLEQIRLLPEALYTPSCVASTDERLPENTGII